MSNPNIIAYLKPTCRWSRGVRAVLDKYGLSYDTLDVVNNPRHREEMIRLSGQTLSPCVQIDDQMLADVSGEEVEAYLLENNLVASGPTRRNSYSDQPCEYSLCRNRTAAAPA